VTLSYLAFGLGWQASYVALTRPEGGAMALDGWLTLDNLSRFSVRAASVSVVAGTLNLAPIEAGGSRLVMVSAAGETDSAARIASVREALEELEEQSPPWPLTLEACGRARRDLRVLERRPTVVMGTPTAAAQASDLEEVMVTGARVAEREAIGDYHLYRVPWATDVAAEQTKQIAFLHAPAVESDRFYRVRLTDFDDEPSAGEPAVLMLRWMNRSAQGLGEPLPSGMVRVYEAAEGGAVLAGEAPLRDTPEGEEAELELAAALDLAVDFDVDERAGHRFFHRVARRDVTVRVESFKSSTVPFELHHAPGRGHTDVRIDRSALRPTMRKGDWVFRLQLPPSATTPIQYRISGRPAD
jgi:hypothetical protein